MDRVQLAERNKAAFEGSSQDSLLPTDPELAAIRDRLVYGEIAAHGTLNAEQRALVTLVALVVEQAQEKIGPQAEAALRAGVPPLALREAVYQCAPYVGFPRVESALHRLNAVFAGQGIALPLPEQATVQEATRFKDGLAVQKRIFGEAIDKMHAATAEQQRDIMVNYLSAYCFGDFYTRGGLDLPMRELLTFCMVSALGGCEAQVKAHVQGNAAVGNSKAMLVDALAQMLPYIGFPRTLNALACVNALMPE